MNSNSIATNIFIILKYLSQKKNQFVGIVIKVNATNFSINLFLGINLI